MSQSGFLLIADISGYTEFLQLHNMRNGPLLATKWPICSSRMQK